jgi:hypothetical protein
MDAFGTSRTFVFKDTNGGIEIAATENSTGRLLWRGWGIRGKVELSRPVGATLSTGHGKHPDKQGINKGRCHVAIEIAVSDLQPSSIRGKAGLSPR